MGAAGKGQDRRLRARYRRSFAGMAVEVADGSERGCRRRRNDGSKSLAKRPNTVAEQYSTRPTDRHRCCVNIDVRQWRQNSCRRRVRAWENGDLVCKAEIE